MLHIIERFNNCPNNYEVDENARFEPGQIGSLKIKNGKAIIDICDGINPLGIIDDIKSNKTRHVTWDEVVDIRPTTFTYDQSNKSMSLDQDFSIELKNRNIISSSFKSGVSCQLKPKEGIIVVPKGTVFNDTSGINFLVRYCFNVSNKKNDDSTAGTKRCTIWYKNMIAQTNMFDTIVDYHKYSNLYVVNGLLTSARWAAECKCIGKVLHLPTYDNPLLTFLFDPDCNVEVG